MRKAFPVSLAKRLVRATKVTRVIAGRNSIQAIIQDLGLAYTQPQGGMVTDAFGFLAAGEFSSFTVRDQDALTILTDLYDTHDHEPEWKNLLKSGTETLTNPCLTMLAASNKAHLDDKISEVDIDGGFIGRTLVIVGDSKYKINPLVDKPEVELNIPELAEYLTEISKLKGPFQWTPEGMATYKEWYADFNSREHDDRTGTVNRLHDHILKVSMLISLSKGTELILRGEDVKDAIMSCMSFMSNVTKTILPGKSELSKPTKLVLSELLSRPDHKLSRSRMLNKYYGDMDSVTLDRVAETLNQAGLLIIRGSSVMQQVYELSPEAARKFESIKE
jgi:hypothetical protein